MKEVQINGKEIRVASTVDALGLFCPMPVVRLKLELEKVKPGQIVELLADDRGVLEDVPVWCNETGNKLLSLREDNEGVFVSYVERQK